jgi:endonuclease/exonuclease/phosphatase family metal-dependent hydrolase
MRVSLATYNIHSCIGSDGAFEPDRIAQVLRELDADVVALQEVDSRAHRGLELLQCLAAETGFTPIPGPTLLRQTRHYGNALMTKLKASDIRRVDLSLIGHEPRGALDVDLDCDGVRLQIIATHLGLNPAERRVQVQRLLDRFSTRHCVLMGDLNEWFLWGRPLRWLKAIFGRTPAPPTFPAVFPLFALDRIWVRPSRTLVRVEVHCSPLARRASDHLPLKAIMELEGQGP